MFVGSGSTLVSVVKHGGYGIGYDVQQMYLDMQAGWDLDEFTEGIRQRQARQADSED